VSGVECKLTKQSAVVDGFRDPANHTSLGVCHHPHEHDMTNMKIGLMAQETAELYMHQHIVGRFQPGLT
jgi:hypothetical protein